MQLYCSTTFPFEIAMFPADHEEIATLVRHISARQLDVENQAVLIEILERDGHDMLEQRKKLAEARSDLATQMSKQLGLLEDKMNVEERRKHARVEVDETAYIFGDGSSLRCRVVNMSAQGASIELPSKRHVNGNFQLMFQRDRTIRSCRLIWSSGDRIGVSFEDI